MTGKLGMVRAPYLTQMASLCSLMNAGRPVTHIVKQQQRADIAAEQWSSMTTRTKTTQMAQAVCVLDRLIFSNEKKHTIVDGSISVKKKLLLLIAFMFLSKIPAMAATANHLTDTLRYATTIDTTRPPPACGANQVVTKDATGLRCVDNFQTTPPCGLGLVLTYNGSVYSCVNNFIAANCVPPNIMYGINPNGSPQCSPPPATPGVPTCTATQSVNSNGVTVSCAAVSSYNVISEAILHSINSRCNVGQVLIAMPADWNRPAMHLFEGDCINACNTICASSPGFVGGTLVTSGGGNAGCLCFR